jgi:hypothetical protein
MIIRCGVFIIVPSLGEAMVNIQSSIRWFVRVLPAGCRKTVGKHGPMCGTT